MILHKVHIISKITELHVNIKGLREQINRNLIVTLELEPVPNLGLEALVFPVIPYHADLINKDNRIFGKVVFTYERDIKRPTSGHIHRTVNRFPFLKGIYGEFGNQRCFSSALFTEYHNQLVGIAELCEVTHYRNRQKSEDNYEPVIPEHQSFLLLIMHIKVLNTYRITARIRSCPNTDT